MRNMFKLIASDAKRLSANVVAIIVVIGLSVLPCLYAWFNIISNWDPYGEDATKNLQVAVASDDIGVELGGMELNIGDKIISNLKENTTIGWQFPETSEEAVDGVHAGDYYAALVIDEQFSEDLISFLGDDLENPKITYYENEKKNAIAPKITSKVKTTIQTQVDQAFISTIAGVILDSSSALISMDSDGNLTEESQQKLNQLDTDMRAVIMILDSYIALMDSSAQTMTATQAAADSAEATMSAAESMMEGTEKSIKSVGNSAASISSTMNSLIKASESAVDSATDSTNSLLNAAQQAAQKLANAVDTAVNVAINDAINSEDTDSQLKTDLITLQEATKKQSEDIASVSSTLQNALSTASSDLKSISTKYNSNVAPQITKTVEAANNAVVSANALLNYDTSSLDAVANSLDNYPDMISQSRESLVKARDEAAEMERKLAIICGNVDEFEGSDESDMMYTILSMDSDYLADFISNPVKIDEQKVYAVANNGSATAPFYMVLSIWVGALIMSTILKTKVEREGEFADIKNWQVFFGRYFTTFFIGQIQTVITVLGALLYVGIQCEHPFLLWVACSWTATVFSFLLYSFTYAFGNVGEALSVVLMVIQVAGSGGTFPIEVLPKVFQYLYAMMPFKYAMNACRECIGGFYQHNYIINLVCLLPFVALAIINGLFLYFQMLKLNEQIEKSKEKSGILI